MLLKTPTEVREHSALVVAVYEAHEARDVSRLDALESEAKRLNTQAPDVLRRLADLKRWRDEGGGA